MTIQQTIARIDRELAGTLDDYRVWFEADADLLHFRPAQGWSIGQILEHVTLTNHFLLIIIRKGQRKALELSRKKEREPLPGEYRCQLSVLDDIARSETLKWMRPDHMEPRGEKGTEEVRMLLDGQIAECRSLLAGMPNGEGALYRTTLSVNNLGKIDVYQYLYFLCLHAKRHIGQMRRVKAEYEARRQEE